MVRIQIVLEDRSLKGIIIAFLSKIITNEYFLFFLIIFTLRNLAELITQIKRKNTLREAKKGTISLLLLIVSFLISGIATGYYLFISAERNFYAYCTGLVLLTIGYTGRQLTLNTLGKNYNQYIGTVSKQELVTFGIYSILRHPLYAFYMIEMIAFVIIRWNYISLFALLIVFLLAVYRIRVEETLLAGAFGERFEAYCKTTKKLIPFIY